MSTDEKTTDETGPEQSDKGGSVFDGAGLPVAPDTRRASVHDGAGLPPVKDTRRASVFDGSGLP